MENLIKAISLHQPWASLIASQHKHYETRSWPISYRGTIAIHAAKKFHNDHRLLRLLGITESEVPLGAVVAIASLTDCIQMDANFIASQSGTEQMCGNWSIGRWAWKLENIQAIEPISQRGYQGLWDWQMPEAKSKI
jgi:ASCH domain